MKKHSIVIFMITLFLIPFLFVENVASYPYNSVQTNYKMYGIYNTGDEVSTLSDITILCVGNIDDDEIIINIVYGNTQSRLPYNVPKSYFILDKNLDDFYGEEIKLDREQFPFVLWYYREIYTTSIEHTENIDVSLKWDKHTYILYEMVIQESRNPINRIVIEFTSTNIDLNENYSAFELYWMRFVVFSLSAPGLFLYLVIFVCIIVLIIILMKVNRMNKKKRVKKTRMRRRR